MCEFDLCIRRFYTAVNSIGLYANTRFASEMSKLQLMESFVCPYYGCEVLYISNLVN